MSEAAERFPNPKSQLNVIRRYLHVLALLQNNRDPQDWNGTTLADYLVHDDADGEVLSDKVIRDYITKILENDLGLDLNKQKGGRRIELSEPLPHEFLVKLMMTYCDFVVTDSQKSIVLSTLIAKKPDSCLWLLGRIYFASKTREKIEIQYTDAKGEETKIKLHPYHLVMRNNNLYLVAYRENGGNTGLFIVNRISELKVFADEHFNETVPAVSEIFKYTLGSYISSTTYDILIRYRKNLDNVMKDIFAGLDSEFTEKEDCFEVSFTASDVKGICKQLFLYGRGVEILSPKVLREEMVSMLRESLAVYIG